MAAKSCAAGIGFQNSSSPCTFISWQAVQRFAHHLAAQLDDLLIEWPGYQLLNVAGRNIQVYECVADFIRSGRDWHR